MSKNYEESEGTSLRGSGDVLLGASASDGIVIPTVDKVNQFITDAVSGKQDTITDLAAIRSGATKGETALQPNMTFGSEESVDWSGVAAGGEKWSFCTDGHEGGFILSCESTDGTQQGYLGIGDVGPEGRVSIYATDGLNITANTTVSGSVTATSFIKSGGTSSQFLKADGSVDSNSYATSSQLSGKQDALVSGTNIKTINSTSLLGSGDIDTKEIFWAVCGTTTFNEVTAATAAGKEVLCHLNSLSYRCSYAGGPYAHFFSFEDNAGGNNLIAHLLSLTRDGQWSNNSYAVPYSSHIKGFYVSGDVYYNPMRLYDTYLNLYQSDGTYAAKTYPTGYTQNNKYFIDVTLKSDVTQKETVANNFYPIAIAGRQYVNMTDGNVLLIYYNQYLTLNPGTGVIRANDFSINGQSVGIALQNFQTAVWACANRRLITWSNLKSLRDSSGLTAGMQYHITDYNTTTVQANTQAAGHQFDIIVVADDDHTLNENARAVRHEGDTYFSGSTLEAWELKYDIDNDTTRFAWADSGATGRGVIYYMKDEWGNECPYDFKNIMFKPGAKTQPGTVADVFYYTFSVATGTGDATVTDHSLNGVYCYGNKISVYIKSSKQTLPSNVFRNTSTTSRCYSNTFGDNCHFNTLGGGCYSNTFGNSCYDNTFGGESYSNTFGDSCYDNTFGGESYSNTFGDSCNSNTFGYACYYNTFENYCNSNTFGDSCNSNTFGNSCYNNTFGDDCGGNTFGNTCGINTFGYGCYSNTFGYGCHANTFGDGCNTNTFGNYCYNNTFGDYCQSNTFGESVKYFITGNATGATTSAQTKDYIQYLIVENGVQYVNAYCTGTTSDSDFCQNIKIGLGVEGTFSNNRLQIDITPQIGATASVTYQPANSQIININI
jgi:hypothetical protein